jgi:2-polyprenyl-6-methoxyphenol hydroxylase-like FAD-dependent oxidoreductase
MSTPVLIVGGGVGGLAASTLLAHQGINSLLVERRREIFLYPKARNLTFPLLTGSAGAAWARAAELLVRPDDFIGWRSERLPSAPEESLRQVLCQILGQR